MLQNPRRHFQIFIGRLLDPGERMRWSAFPFAVVREKGKRISIVRPPALLCWRRSDDGLAAWVGEVFVEGAGA